jgi:lysophospholipase L1-like esterase
VGASNLGHSVPHFDGTNFEFVPVIKPGWVATVENVAELAGIVKSLAPTATMFVFDLFGNSSIRFEQFDGTTALPFRMNGKYHLGGKIVTAPAEIFKRVIENVIPVIREKGNKPCVIIPPLPRYLFARCCSSPDHCTNMHEKNFQETLMRGFIQLRTNIIQQLAAQGLTNFKVMDACCPTNCSLTADVGERIVELKKITAKDGVHFVDAGYRKIAERVTACIEAMMTGDCKPPGLRKPTVHFWRGFRSRRGSLLPRMGNSNHHLLPAVAARGSLRGSARG